MNLREKFMRILIRLQLILLCLGFISTSALAAGLQSASAVLTPSDIPPIKVPVDPVPSFTKYVNTCKSELEFDAIPQFSCVDIGFRGAPREGGKFSNSNDFVAHRKINHFVDAVFACRWVASNPDIRPAISGELIVHNRSSGKTCFFQLQNVGTTKNPAVDTTNPPSPTGPLAYLFWDKPEETVKTKCTGCHSAGPWIASAPIVAALASYGLINDGHDTFGTKYTAVGSIGPELNKIAQLNRQPSSSALNSCASQCHIVGGVTPAGTNIGKSIVPDVNVGFIAIPSINIAIDELLGISNPNFFKELERMPPTDPYSNFRWINRDTPADAGDYERLSAVETEYNEIYKTCKNPQYMQAHEVDNTLMMETDDFVDTIDTFNLHDGLICLNADQTTGRCNSYETRYRCNGKWTTWQSHDSPGSTGDHEKRSSYSFPATCTAPYAIQARYYIGDEAHIVNGSPDRLYQFDKNGLVCRNKDQPDGKCHDYTVRFMCP
jgi:Mucin-2 protein WxxW repeating region